MDLKSSAMIDLENDPELMTAAEVAKVLHIATSSAYLLMQRKEIPTIKIGRSVRVRRMDLEQYINDHYQVQRIRK